MAKAFKDAVKSGRNSFLAGRMKKNSHLQQVHQLKDLFNFFLLLTHNVRKDFFSF